MLSQEPGKIQAERDVLCLKLEMVSVSFTARFLAPPSVLSLVASSLLGSPWAPEGTGGRHNLWSFKQGPSGTLEPEKDYWSLER